MVYKSEDGSPTIKQILAETFNIGVPSAVSLLSINLLESINLAFVGHLGSPNIIAGVGLGNTLLNFTCLTVIMAVQDALNTFLSQAYGSGNMLLCWIYINRAQVILTLLFLPIILIVIFARKIFICLGVDESASEYAGEYLSIFVVAFYIDMLVDLNRRLL